MPGSTSVVVAKKARSLIIAEQLDFWHLAYSAIIFLLFIGFLPAVRLAFTQVDFDTAFQPFVAAYSESLELWAGLFTVPALALSIWYRDNPVVQGRRIRIFVRVRGFVPLLLILMMGAVIAFLSLRLLPSNYQAVSNATGGYLVLGLYALLAFMAPGFLVYVVNPTAKEMFSGYPLGYREKLRILSRFREFEQLTSSRFSFLLADVYGGTLIILSSGFPYLDPTGLSEIFVDIQIAMRVGPEEEKESVREFFRTLYEIPYRIGTLGTSYSGQVLLEANKLRPKLPSSDEVRQANGIEGAWGNSLLELLRPYREWILVALTVALVVLGILSVVR